MCCVAYFIYVYPVDSQVAYLFVFLVQMPIVFIFASKAKEYWNAPTMSERLYQWQEMMNRCCWISIFTSFSTFLANIFLRVQLQIGGAVIYLVCNTVLIYSSWWMQNVRIVHRGKTDVGGFSAIDHHIHRGARSLSQKIKIFVAED